MFSLPYWLNASIDIYNMEILVHDGPAGPRELPISFVEAKPYLQLEESKSNTTKHKSSFVLYSALILS